MEKIVFNPDKIRVLINEKRNNDKQFRQTHFLKEIKLSLPGLNNILEGKSFPGLDTLIRIANYFGKDLNHFCDLEETLLSNEYSIINASEYMVKRFEELVVENAKMKERLDVYEGKERPSYTMQDVPDSYAAEPATKLKK